MPAGQPSTPRSPERPTIQSLQKQNDRNTAQLDRRLRNQQPGELLVRVTPDDPGHVVGRAWLRPVNMAEGEVSEP